MANQVLYGFVALKDVFADRVTEVGVEAVNNAIEQSIAEHNRQMDALNALFVEQTTDFKKRFKTSQVARLQPLDEFGRALPLKVVGHYDVAFPIQGGGGAWGSDYVAREKMTVEDANNITTTLLNADRRWMRDHILAALFADGNGAAYAWRFTDEEHGVLDIMGLADGDAVKYQIQTGADAGATDDHYLAQLSAIDNSNDPFDDIYAELAEHPENTGEVVCLFPTNLKTSILALAAFNALADANITPGANADRLTGTLGVRVPGTLVGYHDARVWLVEWKSLPNDYLIALSTGGDRALRMRQHAEAALQGFRNVGRREDHPFFDSQWLRLAGFGAWNRVGALVYRIGNASYAVPTNYGSPMA